MKTASAESRHKAIIDSLLLEIPGVEAREMSGFPSYFINKRMFACIHGGGVGIRLPVSTARDLQFSRADVVPFQPHGKASSREWVQVNHDDPSDYEKDLEIFRSSIEFVKAEKRK